ncbi:MAG: class I mannose-6-phosphate isomerase [Deltaproteobacteria bacterium]|nr:class I mannose-6-phosphate isomerase [Deltaproteobacteria bacterium]
MSRLPPLPMRPCFVEKLWGGSRLSTLPAKQRDGHRPPAHAPIGESWEVADLPEGMSSVDDDAVCASFAGQALSAMVQRFGAELVGTDHAPDRFPILVKLIDAAEDLSVQVHPGQDYAASHPGTFSKDEAWLVTDSAAGGRVLHGFVDGVTRASFIEAVRAGRPHELMRRVDVKAGDVLHVSPGVVHAIGAGVVVLEVQEPSDTTFRVWDFDRVDTTGKKRVLHVEQALEVARFGEQPPVLCTPAKGNDDVVTLCQTRSFTMAARTVNGAVDVDVPVSPRSALVLHAEGGEIAFEWEGVAVVVPRGGSCVLPASCGGVRFPARGRPARLIVMQ